MQCKSSTKELRTSTLPARRDQSVRALHEKQGRGIKKKRGRVWAGNTELGYASQF